MPAITAQTAESPGAMRFDGTGGILEVRSVPALDLRDEVALEAWIRPERYDQPGVRLIDKSQAGTQSGYMLDTFPGNSLRLLLAEGLLTARDVLKPGDWTHVTGVFSASRGIYKLYVNGREVAEDNRPAYRKIHNGIAAWLAENRIPHIVPETLPSALCADASHPLTEGYELLAKRISADPTFQKWEARSGK